MKRLLFGFLFFAMLSHPVSAQIARVFLSGTGDDAADCTNASTPCRSLQGALNQTPVAGEIIVMTSGGYGAATITKSVTVNAPAGVVAFDGRTISVHIAATDKVTIRGLSMNGNAFPDNYGIIFSSAGTLVLENIIVNGFANSGVLQSGADSRLIVRDSEFRNNRGNDGIRSQLASGTASLTVEDCRFENNNQTGVLIADGVSAVIRNSVAVHNGTGFTAAALTGGKSQLLLEACVIAHNIVGLFAGQQWVINGSCIIRVSDCDIFNNGGAIQASVFLPPGTASVISYQNNRVYNNSMGETFTGTANSF